MRELKKHSFSKVFDLQNSSRTNFYKNILFPTAKKETWSSSITTLPEVIDKKEFDKHSVLDRFNHQLQTSGLKTSYTLNPDFSWACSDINEIKNNFSVIIHNFGADLSTNLSRRIDKLLIAPLLGFTSLGIYQFNIQILFGLELIPIAIHSFLLSEESSGKKHKKIEYYVILMSIIISLIVFFIAPPVIENILPEYSEGIPSLQLLVLTLIPLSIMAILNAKLQALESKKIGYSALIRIGSLLILIATIGNWYGLMGLSVSVLLSVIFHVIFLAILYTSTNHKQNNSVNSSKL